jgi:hypothetical protein
MPITSSAPTVASLNSYHSGLFFLDMLSFSVLVVLDVFKKKLESTKNLLH